MGVKVSLGAARNDVTVETAARFKVSDDGTLLVFDFGGTLVAAFAVGKWEPVKVSGDD